MNFLKRYKSVIIGILVAVIVLIIAFMTDGKRTTMSEQKAAPTPCATAVATQENRILPTAVATQEIRILPSPVAVKESATPKPAETVTPIPKKQEQATAPPTSEPQAKKQDETDSRLICTLSVKCYTILNNMSKLRPEKTGLIPSDGVVFSETEVEFYEGESVINVLTREMKKNKIHLEFVNVPLYNSAYIEGIANIYERDCGELSGWMYRVNGSFPGYGASQCKLKKGDRIEWLYTCDLGTDIGGGYAPRNGRKNDD